MALCKMDPPYMGIICRSGKTPFHIVGRIWRPVPCKEQHWDSWGDVGSEVHWTNRPKKFKVCTAWVSFQNCPEYSPILQSNFVNIFTMLCFCFVPRCGKMSHVDTKLINFPGSHNFRRYRFLKKKHKMSPVFSIYTHNPPHTSIGSRVFQLSQFCIMPHVFVCILLFHPIDDPIWLLGYCPMVENA